MLKNVFVLRLVLEFFPKELWSTIDPTATETNGVISSDATGKSLRLAGYDKDAELEVEEGGEGKEERDADDDGDDDGWLVCLLEENAWGLGLSWF